VKTTWNKTHGADFFEVTIETEPHLVIRRNVRDTGVGLVVSGGACHHYTWFPHLLAWRMSRDLKADGYTRTA
jgi:hypothetical protein